MYGTTGYAASTSALTGYQQATTGPLDDILNGVMNQPVTVTYAYNAQVQSATETAPQQATMAPAAPVYYPRGIPVTAEQGIWGSTPNIDQTPQHFTSNASWINPNLLWHNVRPPTQAWSSQGTAHPSGYEAPDYEALGIQLAQRQTVIEAVETHYGR